jgi:hypothetical protein
MERTDHWLNHKRLTVYPRMILVTMLVLSIAWVRMSKSHVDHQGKPLGYDFITFWAASHLALVGHAPDAYNIPLIFQAEQIAVPALRAMFGWYYPPTFFLLIWPLALLPYFAAYWTFILSTLTCYLLVFRRIIKGSMAIWCLAAFSGVWMNFFHGQNAFLTAALAAATILCLKHRPTLAGVFLGLLAIKPHLALLFPVALIAIGAWRTLFVAAVTATAFLGAGVAVLGTATLKACLNSLGYARVFLERGFLPWQKMPTVFAFLRLLRMPVAGAYALHALVALGAAYTVWRVWRGSPDRQLRGASLMTATFLISPYVFDYDLAWLAFPIAWLALAGQRLGWLRGEREILVAAWLLPLFMAPLANATHLQFGPFVLISLLWLTLRKAGATSGNTNPEIAVPGLESVPEIAIA